MENKGTSFSGPKIDSTVGFFNLHFLNQSLDLNGKYQDHTPNDSACNSLSYLKKKKIQEDSLSKNASPLEIPEESLIIDTSFLKSPKANQLGSQTKNKNKNLMVLECPISSKNINPEEKMVFSQMMIKSQRNMNEKMSSSTWIREKTNSIWRQMSKFKKIKHGVEKLIENSFLRKISNLTTLHYKIINDLAYIPKNEQNSSDDAPKKISWIQRMCDWTLKRLRKIPTFKSNSKKMLMWDLMMFFIIAFLFFLFSLELSFSIQIIDSTSSFYTVYAAFYIFFLVDVFLKMNTSFYEFGLCVSDKKKILNRYFRKMLIYDLLSFFGYTMNFVCNNSVLRLFFYFSYNNFHILYKRLREEWKTGDLFELVLLLVRVISLAHLLACLWHAIAYFKLGSYEETWLDNYLGNKWFERYILSIYWAITTLCTVGYGDITAKNFFEMFFVSCVMLLGTLVFGYTVNSVGIIISRMDERQKDLAEKMSVIDAFFNKAALGENLKTKVKEYIQYVWTTEDKNGEKTEEILNTLPQKMRDQILLESTGKFLKSFPVLNKNFSLSLIEKISLKIKPIRYSPCDIIYKKGDRDNPAICFITEGEIELLYDNEKKPKSHYENEEIILKQLKKGDCFGQVPFFIDCPYEETARSRTFSTVLKIQRSEFLELLSGYQDDLEKFCMIKDSIIFKNDYVKTYTKCFSCNKFNHRFVQCPYFKSHYEARKDIFLQKLIFSKPQFRALHKRKNHIISKHTLQERKKVMKSVINIRFNKGLMRKYNEILEKSKENQKNNENNENSENEEEETRVEESNSKLKRTLSLNEIKEKNEIPMIRSCKSEENIHLPEKLMALEEYPKQSNVSLNSLANNPNNLNVFTKNNTSVSDIEFDKKSSLVLNDSEEEKAMHSLNTGKSIQEKRGIPKMIIATKKLMTKNESKPPPPIFVHSNSNKNGNCGMKFDRGLSNQKMTPLLREKENANSITKVNAAPCKEKGDLFFFDFEQMKEFEHYRKENNYSAVVKDLHKKKANKVKVRICDSPGKKEKTIFHK